MFKNRFILLIGVVSLLSVTMAVSGSRPKPSPTEDQAASDFYQRHPDWTWTVHEVNAVDNSRASDYFQRHPELTAPSIIGLGAPDYFQRHPELTVPSILGLPASDYFQRHPELTVPSILGLPASDYFQRHPELIVSSAGALIDLTDYHFRHPGLQSSRNIDLTDYFFRHP